MLKLVNRNTRNFWGLVVVLAFAAVCLIHIQSSRAKSNEAVKKSQITVERIPCVEARKMGIK
jgi:hypothetical protein